MFPFLLLCSRSKRNQNTKHSLWQAGKHRKKEKEENSDDEELPSKPKWFDVAQHCAPEQRKFSVEVKAEERKLDKLLRDMKNSLKDFLQGGTKFTMANALNVEIGLVTNRQGALGAVQVDQKTVDEYMKKFTSPAEDADDASVTGSSVVLKAGPCMNFLQVKSLPDVKSCSEKFMQCRNLEQLFKVKEEATGSLELLKELVTSGRNALASLSKGAASIEKEEKQKVKEAQAEAQKKVLAAQKMAQASLGISKGKTKIDQDQLPANVVFEHASTDAQRVHAFPCKAGPAGEGNLASEADLDKPFVITGAKVLKDMSETHDTFKAEIAAFQGQFNGSTQQATTGRGQMKVTDAALKASIYAHFENMLGCDEKVIMQDTKMIGDTLQKVAAPAIFGISKNSVYYGYEFCALACLRYTFTGTRTCAVVRFSQLAEHVSRESKQLSRSLSAGAALHWLQHVSKEKLASFLSSSPTPQMFWITVSAGDMLYLPAGYLVAEKTMNMSDSSGLRLSMIATGDKLANVELQHVEKDAEAMGRSNVARKEALAMY